MAVHFHPLKIKKINRETSDCVSISFEVPTALTTDFEYKEGQSLTVRANIDGEEVRRTYSICSAPSEQQLKIAVKAVTGGRFSNFAQHLKSGDILEVMPPVGNFNARADAIKPGKFLAIAAGSGITPVLSIIKHTLGLHPQHEFTLLYGNKSRSSIIFFEDLEGLKNIYMERFTLLNILSREKTDVAVNYGRIDGAKLQSLQLLIPFKDFESIYICGPEEMIIAASNFLQGLGVEKSKIHFELFTIPGQQKVAANSKELIIPKNDGPLSSITIKLDGRSIDFELSQNGKNILDAALQIGADLPYACKGGVCCSCRAKLTEGEVSMDVNYALEPEEVAQGFILTCQSHPLTKKVV
ncbi:MAG: 2Fe-2S iron-sulfur cluster-binding protein, partial [Ferruginibacter sp.]